VVNSIRDPMCDPPYDNPPRDCTGGVKKWVLAICYDERPTRGVTAQLGAGETPLVALVNGMEPPLPDAPEFPITRLTLTQAGRDVLVGTLDRLAVHGIQRWIGGVHLETPGSIWRWDRDPELIKLGWPPPIRIRSRKFRSRIALENFKRVMARRAIEQRARP
jgi:hypothetical protein